MSKRSKIIIFAILVLSFFLRVYKIGLIPPSLNWDEVSHGYNAYSILKTGKDEWGIKFPLIFRAYGDYKLPLYIYLTVISEFFFGLNSFSVRLVSVLSGVGLTLLAYLITKRITKNNTFSLLAALLTAVSPWSLFLSRIAVEANLGAFLFALGIYFIFVWVENRKILPFVFCLLSFGFSLYTYNSARILVPVFFITLLFLILKRKEWRFLIIFLIITATFSLPIIAQFFDQSAKARFNLVSLIDLGTVNRIAEERQKSKLPAAIVKIVFNRPSFFIYYSVKNYLSNLSPKYLFYKGGSHYQFSFPDHELLFLITAPFLIIGLLRLLKNGTFENKILLLWFFVSFIPSAITKDAPHVLRSVYVLPLPMVFTSLGLKSVFDFLNRKSSFFNGKLLIIFFVFSIFFSFGRWWKEYFTIYPKAYSWVWQYGYSQVIDFLRENYNKYDKIFFTKRYGEPHEFILFYYPWNPLSYQKDAEKKWNLHENWYWVDKFDKFYFLNDWEVTQGVKCEIDQEKCLLITSPGNYPEGWKQLKTINFLDERQVFQILER